MRKFLLLLVSAFLVPSGAQAQEAARVLRLKLGSQVVLKLDSSAAIRTDSEAAEPLSSAELEGITTMLREHPDAFGPKAAPMYDSPGQTSLPSPQPNSIRFRFVPFEGGSHSLLVIENGVARSYKYKARIGRGDKSAMTDVCQLIPEKRNVEHWPYQIEWIEITEVQEIPYEPNKPPLCA